MKEVELETELSNMFEKAVKEFPDKFPKMGPTRFTGQTKGFRIIEGNEEQVQNLVAFWAPTEKWKLTPFFEQYPAAQREWLAWREKQ
jgi:hypothetical protein